jgi:hypothetical protein
VRELTPFRTSIYCKSSFATISASSYANAPYKIDYGGGLLKLLPSKWLNISIKSSNSMTITKRMNTDETGYLPVGASNKHFHQGTVKEQLGSS